VLPGCTSSTPSESTLIRVPSGAVPERTMLAPAADTVTFLLVLVMRASVFSPSTKTTILFDGEFAIANAIDFVSPGVIPSVRVAVGVVVVVVVLVAVDVGATNDVGAVVAVDGRSTAIDDGSVTGEAGSIVATALWGTGRAAGAEVVDVEVVVVVGNVVVVVVVVVAGNVVVVVVVVVVGNVVVVVVVVVGTPTLLVSPVACTADHVSVVVPLPSWP